MTGTGCMASINSVLCMSKKDTSAGRPDSEADDSEETMPGLKAVVPSAVVVAVSVVACDVDVSEMHTQTLF